MSLTSYRAAPPRGKVLVAEHHNRQTADLIAEARRCKKSSRRGNSALRRPGNGLLSQVLRHSTIGAKAFDGRVRDGIGSCHSAKATRPAKGGLKQAGAMISARCRRKSGNTWASINESVQANRAISTGKLHTLLCFHTRPINVVVFHGS
jgi:hypothetical protein